MKRNRSFIFIALVFGMMAVQPPPALAYVGPGAGLSAVGALLAVIAAVAVSFFGFVWYPVKRLIRKWREFKNRKNDGTRA